MSLKQEIAEQALRATPPVAVTAVTIVQGFSLNEWVAIATFIYIALQIAVLLKKEIRSVRESKLFKKKVLDESGDE